MYLRVSHRFAVKAIRPSGKAMARYPRAMSRRKTVDATASTPNTVNVAVHTRRYSSSPLPMMRGDRVRWMVNAAIKPAAREADTNT